MMEDETQPRTTAPESKPDTANEEINHGTTIDISVGGKMQGSCKANLRDDGIIELDCTELLAKFGLKPVN